MWHFQKCVLFSLNLGTSTCSCNIAINSSCSGNRAMMLFKTQTEIWGFFTTISKGIKIFFLSFLINHWALDVSAYLNDELENKWVGRAAAADDALLLWPPRSPDLTPLDYFLWGFVKGKVYYPLLANSTEELKERIRLAVTLVTPQVLKKVWGNMARRLQKTIDVKGRQFENLKFWDLLF